MRSLLPLATSALLALVVAGCSKNAPPPVDGPPPEGADAEHGPPPGGPDAHDGPEGHDDRRGHHGRRGRRGPPPEAIAACDAKAAGAACSFTLRERALSGKCETGPREGAKLACRPPRGEGRPHGPPSDGSSRPQGPPPGAPLGPPPGAPLPR